MAPQQWLEPMEYRALITRLIGPTPTIVLSVVLVGVLFILSAAAQHSPRFADHYSTLLAEMSSASSF